MQKAFYLVGLFIFLTLAVACDSTDEAQEVLGAEEENPRSYFSSTQGNMWTYDVSVDAMAATQDVLTVVTPVVQNGQLFTDLEATPTSTGFMTGLLANGLLFEDDAQLTYSGSLAIPVDPTNPILIDIPTSIVYDEAIAAGTQLSVNEQTITQDLNGQPITIDVVATTRQLGIVENSMINGFAFERAIRSELIVNATITTTVLGISVTLLPAQEVLIASNTYAENIGLVDSTVTLDYEFVDLTPFGITLPFPSENTVVTTQQITLLNITN